MKMKLSLVLLCILVLFCGGLASASIGPVSGLCGAPSHASASPITFTCTPNAGDQIHIAIAVNFFATYALCYDNFQNTVFPAQKWTAGSPGTGVSVSTFNVVAASSVTSYKCAWFGGTGASGTIQELSGALSFNTGIVTTTGACSVSNVPPAACAGNSSSAVMAFPFDDGSGDYAICDITDTSATYSALTGSVLQAEATNPSLTTFGFAQSGSTGSCGATLSTSGNWVELVTTLRPVAATQPTYLGSFFNQITYSGNSHFTGGCAAATGTGTYSCTFPIASLIGGFAYFGGISNLDGGTQTLQSLSSFYDCNSSSGCTSGNTINSWTIPSSCNVLGRVTGNYAENVFCAYTQSPIPGATYATFTVTPNLSASLPQGVLFVTPTYSPDGAATSQGDSFESMTHTMTPASTVTGTCDTIIQTYAGGTNLEVTSPYVIVLGSTHFNWAVATCQTSGNTTPTWTSTESDAAAGNQISLIVISGQFLRVF